MSATQNSLPLTALLLVLGACSVATPIERGAEITAREPEIVLPYEPANLHVVMPVVSPVPARVVFHGPRDRKFIALTFDACATRVASRYDGRITQVLIDKHVPATLFLGGKWIEENVEHARYLASLPQFELGNHTFLHPHLTHVSDARLHDELAWDQALLYTVTGRRATLFRAPYGEYDDRVVKYAAAEGMTTVQYDIASGDPDANIGREQLIRYVVESARPGSIVVMHINRRGWHTAEALPAIIDALRSRGYTFVTVGQLLESEKRPDQLAREDRVDGHAASLVRWAWRTLRAESG